MSELSGAAGQSLREALGAEHAAVWVYGLARAFAGESGVRDAIDEATETHRTTRDTAQALLRKAGWKPAVAQPAYDVGETVDDQGSAIKVLIRAESDCQTGWRAVLEATEDPNLRRTALNALTDAATCATRWRLTIGEEPAVQNFPGKP